MKIDKEKTKLAIEMLKIVSEIAYKGKENLPLTKLIKLEEALLKMHHEILKAEKRIQDLNDEIWRLRYESINQT